MSERRQVLLRIDPAVHDALMRWAGDEFRSLNAQVEVLLRRALVEAGPDAPPRQADAATRSARARSDRLRGHWDRSPRSTV